MITNLNLFDIVDEPASQPSSSTLNTAFSLSYSSCSLFSYSSLCNFLSALARNFSIFFLPIPLLGPVPKQDLLLYLGVHLPGGVPSCPGHFPPHVPPHPPLHLKLLQGHLLQQGFPVQVNVQHIRQQLVNEAVQPGVLPLPKPLLLPLLHLVTHGCGSPPMSANHGLVCLSCRLSPPDQASSGGAGQSLGEGRGPAWL